MKSILMFCTAYLITLNVQAGLVCKPGYDFSTDKWGNEMCLAEDGRVFSVIGSLSHCPAGYNTNTDKYGNNVCQYQQVRAYDLSKGCLAGMDENTDKFGNRICLDANGKNVTRLIKPTVP